MALKHQLSVPHVALDYVRPRSSGAKLFVKASNRQLSTSQAAFLDVELNYDKSRVVFDAGGQKRQDLEALLTKVRHGLAKHSSFLRSSL